MSTTSLTQANSPDTGDQADLPVTQRARGSMATLQRLVREPLLHFLVLGGLLFAVDHAVHGRQDDMHTIVMGPEVDAEARSVFRAERGRDPNAQELTALRKVWLDNEVLYREGLAMQVDRGDPAIRDRVIFKALSVVDANTTALKPDDQVLRPWFEAHRAKYDEPPRFDFQEAVLSGENSEEAVRGFVAMLNSGKQGDTNAGLRVFKGRPLANLDLSYGPEFAKALATATPQEWRAYKTKEGWRAIRLEAMTPGKPAVFESVRAPVFQDWNDATLSQQRSDAVAQMAKKYKIVHQEAGQ